MATITAARRRTFLFDRETFSWQAVLIGAVTALVVQILLTMLGLGIGLIALEAPAANASPIGVSWGAFAYWAISGIVAAFVGGWVAGAVAMPGAGGAHGLAAWAVATVVVIAAAGLMAGSTASIASNLVGPTAVSIARLDDLTKDPDGQTTGRRGANQQQIEAARQAVAAGMLASFFALLIGAGAGFMGGRIGHRSDVLE